MIRKTEPVGRQFRPGHDIAWVMALKLGLLILISRLFFGAAHRPEIDARFRGALAIFPRFLAPVPPLLAVCRNDDELIRAIPLFTGSFMANDRCLPAPGAAPILAALSPATIRTR
jgi:hypothetical protein